MDDEVLVVPTPPGPPDCCGGVMVSLRKGAAAGFEIELWRCPVCERVQTTFVRVDGQRFWVGAMGRAIRAEQLRLVSAAYGVE